MFLTDANFAERFHAGKKNVRRLLLAISLLVVLVDLLSFVTRAGGPALAVIAVLLAFASLLLFRPAVSDLVEENHRVKKMGKRD